MDPAFLGDTPLYPRAKYSGELRPELPHDAFELARSRVALIPLYVAVIVAAIVAIARHWVPWEVVPLLSIVIGVTFALIWTTSAPLTTGRRMLNLEIRQREWAGPSFTMTRSHSLAMTHGR